MMSDVDNIAMMILRQVLGKFCKRLKTNGLTPIVNIKNTETYKSIKEVVLF